MQSLPSPCPAGLVPDATGLEAFNAAYTAAKRQRAVFVAVEGQGRRWTARADMLTAPQQPAADAAVLDAVRAAAIHLIRSGEIRPHSSVGPVYFALYGLQSEHRARELAAALHAALCGDTGPLAKATPGVSVVR